MNIFQRQLVVAGKPLPYHVEHECQAHGVGELPRRFVPVFDRDDVALKARIGDRIVTRGEWVHGAALMRWHLAKEQFYSTGRALKAERFTDLVGAQA
jgi:hypothetical protein